MAALQAHYQIRHEVLEHRDYLTFDTETDRGPLFRSLSGVLHYVIVHPWGCFSSSLIRVGVFAASKPAEPVTDPFDSVGVLLDGPRASSLGTGNHLRSPQKTLLSDVVVGRPPSPLRSEGTSHRP